MKNLKNMNKMNFLQLYAVVVLILVYDFILYYTSMSDFL